MPASGRRLRVLGHMSVQSIDNRTSSSTVTVHEIQATMQENPAFARAALRAGALGYVLKEAADAELMTAVLAAAEGRTYLNPELGAKLAAQPPEGATRPDGLSPREIEVLRLVALGHTNTEIAESLFLSVGTESHRSHIQHKVGVTTRADLVGYARRHSLLD